MAKVTAEQLQGDIAKLEAILKKGVSKDVRVQLESSLKDLKENLAAVQQKSSGASGKKVAAPDKKHAIKGKYSAPVAKPAVHKQPVPAATPTGIEKLRKNIKEYQAIIDEKTTSDDIRKTMTAAIKKTNEKISQLQQADEAEKKKQVEEKQAKQDKKEEPQKPAPAKVSPPAKPAAKEKKSPAPPVAKPSEKKDVKAKYSGKKPVGKPGISRKILNSKKVQEKYRGTPAENIKRDSRRHALGFGKRISKEGNVYYEYRANRADLRKKYPLLEHGGEILMADGGQVGRTVMVAGSDNIAIYGYQTKNFDICAAAVLEFQAIMEVMAAEESDFWLLDVQKNIALAAERIDMIFGLEKASKITGVVNTETIKALTANMELVGIFNCRAMLRINTGFVGNHVVNIVSLYQSDTIDKRYSDNDEQVFVAPAPSADDSPVDGFNEEAFLDFMYPQLSERLAAMGFKLREHYALAKDGWNNDMQGKRMYEMDKSTGIVDKYIIQYYNNEDGLEPEFYGSIIIDLIDKKAEINFPDNTASISYEAGGEIFYEAGGGTDNE